MNPRTAVDRYLERTRPAIHAGEPLPLASPAVVAEPVPPLELLRDELEGIRESWNRWFLFFVVFLVACLAVAAITSNVLSIAGLVGAGGAATLLLKAVQAKLRADLVLAMLRAAPDDPLERRALLESLREKL